MSTTCRRELRRAVAVAVHSLEARLLLAAADAWVIKGDVNPKAPSEAIVVSVDPQNPSQLRATINGNVISTRAVAGLARISIGGGRGADLISMEIADAAGGDDIDVHVWGGRGNDTILGGSGDQCFYGGPGDDVLDAADGNDTLWGNNGDDDLSGGDDGDWLCGDAGNDTLAGNWGKDRLLGADGSDFLDGGEDRDRVRGGAGQDTLKGGGGKDAITGGDDADLKFLESGKDTTDDDPDDRTRREKTSLPVTRVSAETLRSRFRQLAIERWEGMFGLEVFYGGGLCGPPTHSPPNIDRGSLAASGDSESDHSSTNVQEAGVDEDDVVETDGRYIYSIVNYYGAIGTGDVVITDTRTSQVVARYDPAGDAMGLYLIGDRLTILSWKYEYQTPPVPAGGVIGMAPCSFGPPVWYEQTVHVTVLDVSDPASPEKLEQTELDGGYVSSRAIGERVYVVVDNAPHLPIPQYVLGEDNKVFYESKESYVARLDAMYLENAVPGWKSTDAAGRNARGSLLQNDEVFVAEGDDSDLWSQSYLSVALVDVGDEDAGADASTTISGYYGTVYASDRSLYIAEDGWGSETSNLFKFTLGADSIDLAATAKVPGFVNNQFSMDEDGDYLRIATQVFGDDGASSSSVHVMDQVGDELRIVGAVDHIAPNESLFAARFVGDRAYLITFQQVDPLFTIDLSDPARPRVAGELIIPGFSRYLHPIDETHLIGVGQSATGRVELSLFDVSDIANPKRVGTYEVPGNSGNGWEYTTAEEDHHAFSYFPAQGVLAFPITISKYDDQGNYNSERRLEVVEVNPARGFDRLGAITHDGDDDVLRSVRIGQKVFSIGTQTIKVANLDSPSNVLATIDLTEEEQP